jgi:hypothetical protein
VKEVFVGQEKVVFGNPDGAYAIASDFCRIFSDDMNQLMRLAYLLTADVEKAEECFVSGLEDCSGSNRVFREWAQSWARRAVIQNAIRTVLHLERHGGRSNVKRLDDSILSGESAGLAPVLELNPFERFVFVLSVLERYPDQDCAALLGHSRRDIVWARIQAMKHLSKVTGAASVKDRAKNTVGIFPPALLANSA